MPNIIRLFPWELKSMPEYSCTLPSATTLWKMWKRDVNEPIRFHKKKDLPRCWVVGQFIPHETPGFVGIRWFEVHLREGPKPVNYKPPDWNNFQCWRLEQDERRSSMRESRPS